MRPLLLSALLTTSLAAHAGVEPDEIDAKATAPPEPGVVPDEVDGFVCFRSTGVEPDEIDAKVAAPSCDPVTLVATTSVDDLGTPNSLQAQALVPEWNDTTCSGTILVEVPVKGDAPAKDTDVHYGQLV